MKKNKIVIILVTSALLLVTLLAVQLFWITKSFNDQKKSVQIQKEQLKILNDVFDSKVTLALTNVRDLILKMNKDTESILLEPIEKIDTNYFMVTMPEKLSHKILKQLLVNEFEKQNIKERFNYVTYDCASDTIYCYNDLNTNDITVNNELYNQIRTLRLDGYYFGVIFNDRDYHITVIDNSFIWYVWGSSIIALVYILMFITSSTILLKQKKLSEIKNDFINNMTHELKTPISTISLSSEMLQNPKVQGNKEMIDKYANIVKKENKRLQNQVDKVLQVALLDKGDVDLKIEPLNIHQIIQESIQTFQLKLEEFNGKISFKNNTNDEIVISGDKVHVNNIIRNILDNSIKYCDTEQCEPSINIELIENKNSIIVTLKDNGIGIKKEDLKHIFDKFYRVSTGNIHNVKGFGLGLYYVHEMMLKHHGKIDINSKINQGTIVTLTFPK